MKVLMIFSNTNEVFSDREMLYLNEVNTFISNEELQEYFCKYVETMSEDLSKAIYNYGSSVEEVYALIDRLHFTLTCDLEGIESSSSISQIITMYTECDEDEFSDMYIGIVYEV